MPGALEHLATALEAGEGGLRIIVGFAQQLVLGHGTAFPALVAVFVFGELALPELGFGFAEAAEEPLGIDEHVDQGALGGGLGLELAEVIGGERVEAGGGFATDCLGLAVDAGSQGISGGGGLALGGAGTGPRGHPRGRPFQSVETIGLDLSLGSHK